jgi:hypothetical protein
MVGLALLQIINPTTRANLTSRSQTLLPSGFSSQMSIRQTLARIMPLGLLQSAVMGLL